MVMIMMMIMIITINNACKSVFIFFHRKGNVYPVSSMLDITPCTTLLNSEECALSEKKKKKKERDACVYAVTVNVKFMSYSV